MTGPVGPEIPEPAERSLSGGVRLESVADIAEPADTDRDDNVRRGLDRAEDPGELDSDDAESFDDQPDWAWVEEWREGGEPVPWGPGLTLAGFTLILVASAVYVLSSGLWDRPILAIAVNVLVAAGLGPALWLSRGLPVLRWIAGGAVAGVLAAWLCVLVFLV